MKKLSIVLSVLFAMSLLMAPAVFAETDSQVRLTQETQEQPFLIAMSHGDSEAKEKVEGKDKDKDKDKDRYMKKDKDKDKDKEDYEKKEKTKDKEKRSY